MLKFDEKGLIPVIVQDVKDGTVLMLGYASKESLKLTLQRGEMVFFSRSRKELWHKGETSGNVLKVKSISKDCDSDTLLVRAEPAGPTCHTGERSCFFTGFSEEDLE
jgi:phosphoribosyl-ATP pyrophosphohydrolase/phosphoribosyl-AMP cyclohydrolase